MWFRRTFIASLLSLAIFAAIAPLSTARAEGPKDVLQLVPDDAWGFVVLKSLNNLDDKAAQVKEVIGAQFPTPITPMALMMLNLGDKVDMSMPIAAVMMDAKKYGPRNAGDALILLVPAKDPKALVDSLAVKEADGGNDADDDEEGGNAKDKAKDKGKGKPGDSLNQPETKKPPKEGKGPDEGKKSDEGKESAEGITKIQVMGQPAFAAVKGKYVIVGSNEECITKVVKTKKTMAEGIAEARTAALEKNDVFVSIAMSTVVNAYKDMFMPLLQMATAATDPEGKNIKQLMKVLGETSAVDLALSFDKSGLTFIVLMAPLKDSDMEKAMGDAKNSDKSLLARLPAEKYLLTMGTTGSYSQHNEKFGGDNMFSQMIKSAGAKGLNEEALKTLDAELLKLAKASGPTALCVSFLPDGAEGMFGATVVAELKDPKEYIAGLRNIYKIAWTVAEGPDKDKSAGKKAEGDEGEDEEKPAAKKEAKDDEKKGKESKGDSTKDEIAKIKENVVHAADAETIDGNKIDTLTIKLAGLADMLDVGEDEVGMVQKVLGKEIVIRFGAVEDKYFVLTFGGGKKRFETVCKHLKSPGEGLDKDASIKEASGQLPTPRVSEFYIAVDNIAQAIKSVATALGEGEEFPFEVPTVNAPVAISGAMKGPVQQINIVVPMKLIKAVKEVIEKMSASGGDFDEDEEGVEEDEEAPAKPAAKTGDKADVKKDKGKEKGKDKDKEEEEEEDN
jgi:hypothetical protein